MSLRLKMIVGIGMILLAVIIAFAVITVRMQGTHLREVSRREAQLILAVTERAIARAMTDGQKDEVEAILQEIGALPHLVGLRITDLEGTILRSSRQEERGRALGERGWPADATVAETVRDQAGRIVAVSQVIPNRAACHACHESAQPLLGIIDARVEIPGFESQVARQWTAMVLPTILALVVAGGLIGVYFTFVFGRRIDTLGAGMRRVEAGDLTAEVPEDDRDEVGRLGKSFNVMVSRLAEARRQIEDRHAAEIRRAEHLAALGKLAAGIAHEINNPLAGMQNCVRTLLKGPRDERQRTQYLEMLREGLGRVGAIVSELLSFARERTPRLATTDLAPVVRQSLALLEHEVAARGVVCSVALDAGLPRLVGDPAQLQQVFLNVLMNAIEAMPGGGILAVGTAMRSHGRERLLEVRVTDTGAGIPRENLPRVFDPFFTTKEVGRGTGLGLSVSYGIVKAHGGSIEVESEVGKGTTFTVVLPLPDEGGVDVVPHPARGR
jgi:two-component system, NtrC family, sensor kinase